MRNCFARSGVQVHDSIELFMPQFRIDEALAEIRMCLETGWLAPGETTRRFERAWCDYTRLRHAHFLNSATSGLILALQILAPKPGHVITTPITFVSTNHAILHAGHVPRFVDVDRHLCLDPDGLLAPGVLTKDTRAVVFVGLGGNTGGLARVADICQSRRIPLVLDGAHMAGTWTNGVHVGHEADASVFSFQCVKNLPTGDSGMICFRDEEHDRTSRMLSWMGIDKSTHDRTEGSGYSWDYDVAFLGNKFHGNAIMAALARVGLRYLERDNARRRILSTAYDQLLPQHIERVPTAAGCTSSRHLYQVLLDHRDEVFAHMKSQGITCGVHYRDNRTFSLYKHFLSLGECARASSCSTRVLSLPLHPKLTDEQVARVCESLTQAVAQVH